MLLPKYNLRTILWVMAGFAVFSVVLAEAVRAKPWAAGVVAGACTIPLLLLMNAILYLAAKLIRRQGGKEGQTS